MWLNKNKRKQRRHKIKLHPLINIFTCWLTLTTLYKMLSITYVLIAFNSNILYYLLMSGDVLKPRSIQTKRAFISDNNCLKVNALSKNDSQGWLKIIHYLGSPRFCSKNKCPLLFHSTAGFCKTNWALLMSIRAFVKRWPSLRLCNEYITPSYQK